MSVDVEIKKKEINKLDSVIDKCVHFIYQETISVPL